RPKFILGKQVSKTGLAKSNLKHPLPSEGDVPCSPCSLGRHTLRVLPIPAETPGPSSGPPHPATRRAAEENICLEINQETQSMSGCRENRQTLRRLPAGGKCHRSGGRYFPDLPPADCHRCPVALRAARAVFSCEAGHASELSFQIGAIFHRVTDSKEPGWLEGELDGKRGLIPKNYVVML
uniref:SH3 domain-containing protein n=1 Tax=Paramormyrops kingsleyae TaxID=1676925 RepID=A0A3B3T8R2_9TELE